jgi:hypothetical protein
MVTSLAPKPSADSSSPLWFQTHISWSLRTFSNSYSIQAGPFNSRAVSHMAVSIIGVQVIRQSFAVDGVLRALIFIGARGRDRNGLAVHRISHRLGREAPDLALEDRAVRRRIDLIDPPVVRRAELQTAGRVIRCANLTLTDQDTSRIGRPASLTSLNTVPR